MIRKKEDKIIYQLSYLTVLLTYATLMLYEVHVVKWEIQSSDKAQK